MWLYRTDRLVISYTSRHLLADFDPGLFERVELVSVELLNGLLDLRLVFEHNLEIALEFRFPLFDTT